MRLARATAVGLSGLASLTACSSGASPAAGSPAAGPPARVVVVESQPCRTPQPRLGVGIMLTDGIALTASHVVDGATRTVELDGVDATVVAESARLDLAVVASRSADAGTIHAAAAWLDSIDTATDGPRTSLAQVDHGTATILRPAGPIVADVTRTLTLRVDDVSAGLVVEREAIELGLLVEPGDSGAPVVDPDGNVIGVVVLRRTATNVSYATRIPELPELPEVPPDQGPSPDPAGSSTGDSFAPPVACT